MTISQASIDALLAEAADSGSASPSPSCTAEASPGPAAPSRPRPPVVAPPKPDIERILGLQVPVSVTLAERELDIETILEIKVGTIVEFDVPFDADLTLSVTDQQIGTGQAVKIGEKFGLRITKIADVHGRIEAMGGGKGPS